MLNLVQRLAHKFAEQLIGDLAQEIALDALGIPARQHLAHIYRAVHLVDAARHLVLVGDDILFMMCLFLTSHDPSPLPIAFAQRTWRRCLNKRRILSYTTPPRPSCQTA